MEDETGTEPTKSTEDDDRAGIKYCPGTELELPKYLHVDYKGGNSKRWPVQYHHCAGRAREIGSIPRVEVEDVSLDIMEELNRKESWSTDLETVRKIWKSKEDETERQRLLPTGRRRGDKRASQEFDNLCQKFENWESGGEMSEARRVDTEYPEKLSFSNLKILNSTNTSLRPRQRIKPLSIRSDNSVMRGQCHWSQDRPIGRENGLGTESMRIMAGRNGKFDLRIFLVISTLDLIIYVGYIPFI